MFIICMCPDIDALKVWKIFLNNLSKLYSKELRFIQIRQTKLLLMYKILMLGNPKIYLLFLHFQKLKRVTGNLGGQINILIPIALFGIVQVNAHQVGFL